MNSAITRLLKQLYKEGKGRSEDLLEWFTLIWMKLIQTDKIPLLVAVLMIVSERYVCYNSILYFKI